VREKVLNIIEATTGAASSSAPARSAACGAHHATHQNILKDWTKSKDLQASRGVSQRPFGEARFAASEC